MDEADLRECGERLLPAIAYGDSAGLPYETMDANQVRKHMRLRMLNREDPYTLRPTELNPYIDPQPVGGWSDDTILSVAVARGIIDNPVDPIEPIAVRHVEAYRKYAEAYGPRKFGFGRSTSRAMRRLAKGEDYRKTGEPEGQGNGVLMKMAPLAYLQSARNTPEQVARKQTEALARITHNNAMAVATAQVHRNVLDWLLTEAADDAPKYVLDVALDAAEKVEDDYLGADTTLYQPQISSIFKRMLKKKAGNILNPQAISEINPKGGFHCTTTLGRAYGAFALKGSFPDNMWQAVRLGGDTDSIASIVAGMSALYPNGEFTEPADINKIRDIKSLRQTSKRLAEVALKYT